MTVMLPGKRVSRFSYLIRALIAALVLVVFSVWMVGRSTGITSSDAEVYTEVPVAAGVITTGAPVRYHGIKVGEIGSIEPGTESSRVGLAIDKQMIGKIPSTVMVRVLPRTFFGDIYIQMVRRPGSPDGGSSLSDGDEVSVDDGPDAINLYNIFTKMNDLIGEVKPDQLNVALAAVNRAIGGRGEELGVMIDDWWAASKELEDSVTEFIEATPTFRKVAESLQRATPAIVDTLGSVSNISRGIVDHQDQLSAFFASASGYLDTVGSFVARQRKNLITVVDSTGKILHVVGDNPNGITRTLREAEKFGKAGSIAFRGGRFTITATPTFSQPMPYTAADCPEYGDLRGSDCHGATSEFGVGPVREPGEDGGTVLNPPKREATPSSFGGPEVINGAAEAKTLGELEKSLGAPTSSSDDEPTAATSVMLGPLVRGSEVKVS